MTSSTKALVRDALAVWVEDAARLRQDHAEIQDYLKTFDIQDRYDADGDGDFDEPDGFIDHFQIVHAGGDEAAGDPIYGTDAIWSHRWYTNLQAGGPGGLAGVNVGSNGGSFGLGNSATRCPNNPTGVWVGDYTIQPENGGLGVFAHEFGHDLGLPDLYDTSGNTGGAENTTGFWTLMSSGSNIGDGGSDGIGDDPIDLGAWELFQLGWLDPERGAARRGPFYGVADAGKTVHAHAVQERAGNRPVASRPCSRCCPTTRCRSSIGAPYAGDAACSGPTQGDDLDTRMELRRRHGQRAGRPRQLRHRGSTGTTRSWRPARRWRDWTPVKTNLSDDRE